jgi:flagellar biosynthesis regulator FlbT
MCKVLVLEEKQSNQKDQVSDLINKIYQALHMLYIQIENTHDYNYEITSKFSADLKSDLFKYQLISEIFTHINLNLLLTIHKTLK